MQDIIGFAESVGCELTLVQRLALRFAYGLEPDREERCLPRFRENPDDPPGSSAETEAVYLDRLRRCGRVHDGGHHLALSFGRISGKSYMGGLIAVYETLRLLENFPKNLSPGSKVEIGLASFTVDAAKHGVFSAFDDLADRVPLLRERSAHRADGVRCFQTDEDIRRTGTWVGSRRQAAASVGVRVVPAKPTAMRGVTRHLMVLDEVAHFPDASAEDVRGAAEATLKTVGGRVVALSSPRSGSDFDGLLGEDSNYRSISLPTWEMRPEIPTDPMLRCRKQSPALFYEEWAAEPSTTETIRIPTELRRRLVAKVGEAGLHREIVRILREVV